MTTEVDFERHLRVRDRIRSTLEALKAEGITSSELIECVGNELHLLKLEDEREFNASADELDTPSADSSQTTESNQS